MKILKFTMRSQYAFLNDKRKRTPDGRLYHSKRISWIDSLILNIKLLNSFFIFDCCCLKYLWKVFITVYWVNISWTTVKNYKYFNSCWLVEKSAEEIAGNCQKFLIYFIIDFILKGLIGWFIIWLLGAVQILRNTF